MNSLTVTLQLLLAAPTLMIAVFSWQTSRHHRQRHLRLAALAGAFATATLLLTMFGVALEAEAHEPVAVSMLLLLPLPTLVLAAYVTWRALLPPGATSKRRRSA